MNKKQQKEIQEAFFVWYKKHGRHELPWRHTDDLYNITVSEIMLQQTNVSKVIEKYHAFLRRFPSWKKLASARQTSVMRQWQGLGVRQNA